MAILRFYTCCILFLLLLAGMGLVAAVFFLFWHQWLTGKTALDLMQHEVLFRVFKLVGVYIVVTAGFLAFVGYFFLSRKLLQPIDQLTRQAEEFSGSGESLLFNNESGKGFNRLSRALNHLLQQLENEQKQLRITVQALEKANSELRETQQEMIRAEKLVSIGRLSAGFAHEIGNPLSILSGYLELLKDNDVSSGQARDFLARAVKEAERMDTLLQRLLEFARPSSGQKEPCSLHRLIRDCFDDLRYQPLFKDIELACHLNAPNDIITCDPLKIRQVLLNCAVNAADAIHEKDDPTGNNIIVRTTLSFTPGKTSAEEWIVVELEDTGTGIHPDHVSSVFDPFFTTKDAVKGTGLGLSVCYMIVKEMGGTIEIAGEQGRGSIITVTLPLDTVPQQGKKRHKMDVKHGAPAETDE